MPRSRVFARVNAVLKKCCCSVLLKIARGGAYVGEQDFHIPPGGPVVEDAAPEGEPAVNARVREIAVAAALQDEQDALVESV